MEPFCFNCKYYIQHYLFARKYYRMLGVGHCTHPPRAKTVRPGWKGCPGWTERETPFELPNHRRTSPNGILSYYRETAAARRQTPRPTNPACPSKSLQARR